MAKKRGTPKNFKRKGKLGKAQMRDIKWETVICPTCENGGRFNPSKCVLCEGKGTIKAIR